MVEKGSQDCLSGLDQNDSSRVVTALKEIQQATGAANSVMAWVNASQGDRT
jgi:hypothetical protein